jgi:hypothetical protein
MRMVFLLPLLLAVPAQQTTELKRVARKGDRYGLAVTNTWVEKWKRTVDGKADSSETERWEFKKVKDEVLEIEGTRAVRVKRRFLEWWEEAKAAKDAKPVRSAKVLQGKTITLRRKGTETTAEGPQAWPAAELLRNRLIDDPLLDNLPAGPVAPGHSWTVDEKLLLDDVRVWLKGWEFTSGSAKGTFAKVEPQGGVDCALLVFDVELKGKPGAWQVSQGTIKWQTRAHLSLDRGRVLAVHLEGTTVYTGSSTVGSVMSSIEGSNTFTTVTETVFE